MLIHSLKIWIKWHSEKAVIQSNHNNNHATFVSYRMPPRKDFRNWVLKQQWKDITPALHAKRSDRLEPHHMDPRSRGGGAPPTHLGGLWLSYCFTNLYILYKQTCFLAYYNNR